MENNIEQPEEKSYTQTEILVKGLEPYFEEMLHVLKTAKQGTRRSIVEFEYPEEAQEVSIKDGQVKAEIVNLDELITLTKNLYKAIKDKKEAPDDVTVKNLNDLYIPPVDFEDVEKGLERQEKLLSSVVKLLEELKQKDTSVTVQTTEKNVTISLPTKPSEAIAVRLVDAEGRKFYNAMQHVVASMGGAAKKIAASSEKPQYDTVSEKAAGYDFYAYAQPGSSVTDPVWRVVRIRNTPFEKRYAGGTADFIHTAVNMFELF